MPDVTVVNLVQDAVLWPFAGYDDFGQSLVGDPIDINVRWEAKKREILERDGSEKTSDATVFVDREIALGSVLRLGTVASLPTPPGRLHDVIDYSETPDIKGHFPSRIVQVWRRTTDTPPVVSGGGAVTVSQEVLVYWDNPESQDGDSITISGEVKNLNGDVVDIDTLDLDITVSDGATDSEPSYTATIDEADTPQGTVLSETGTAQITIRTQDGRFSIKVTEPLAAYRYLWIKPGGNVQWLVRSASGVVELHFT